MGVVLWWRRGLGYGGLLAVAACVLLVASPARAGHAFTYAAPQECPGGAGFVAAVSERGPRLEPTPGAADALDVTIERSEAGYEGLLKVRRGEGAWTERRVHGATCPEVADALAVVTAIMLREAAAAPLPPAPPPSTPSAPPPSASPPPELPKPPPAKPRLRATGHTYDGDFVVPKGTVRVLPSYAVNLYGGATVGLLPSALVPRVDLTLTRATFVGLPDGRTAMVGPILRTRGSLFGPSSFASADGHGTNLLGFALGIQLCTSPLYDTEGFVLLGCSGFSAGLARLDTTGPTGLERGRTSALASADFGLEASYNFGRYVHATLRVELNALPAVVRAERPDGTELFRSSVFTGSTLLGLGGHF